VLECVNMFYPVLIFQIKTQCSDVSALQDVDHAHSHAPDVFVCSVSAEEEEMPLPVQVFNFQVNQRLLMLYRHLPHRESG